MYTYKIINKTTHKIEDVSYQLLSHKGTIKVVSDRHFSIPEQGLSQGTLFIELHSAELEKDKITLKIGVFSKGKLIETTTTNFLGPRSYR